MPIKFTAGLMLSISTLAGYAQDGSFLKLENGSIELHPVTHSLAQSDLKIVQFKTIPNDSQLDMIEKSGITLMDYLGDRAYAAKIAMPLNSNNAVLGWIEAVSDYPIWAKKGQYLYLNEIPTYAQDGNKVGVIASSVVGKQSTLLEWAHTNNIDGVSIISPTHVQLWLKPNQIKELIGYDWLYGVEVVSDPGSPESEDGRNLHRSGAIDRKYSGGYSYDGTGVGIGINDDGYVGPHIDYTGRINNQEVAGDFNGDHGDMCAGIAGASGNLDPDMDGMAPGSYLYIRQYSSAMPGSVALHQDSGIMVFSTSYSNGCNAGYTSTTNRVDDEIYVNRSLSQVFSAGNSNNNNCGYGAGDQWGNITGGHKIGKNVIAVANLFNDDELVNSSSRGPAFDGRIKPDLAAHGQGQLSTDPNNTYAVGGGTSAAAPGVAGVVAQLYEAYRDFNGGADPESGLLKAALLNTANDLGNKGPDFKFGWGKVNALRALQLLEENRYFSGSLAHGDSISYTLQIPANVVEAKVMVYWMDQPGATAASIDLVNDFDAQLIDPSGNVTLPYILDDTPDAALLDLPATTGVDHLNNMEQLYIENPVAGNYTLKVKADLLPFGMDDFIVVYEYRTDELTLTYPLGGESWLTNDLARIHWDGVENGQPITVQLSVDNGANWSTLTSASTNPNFIDFNMGSTVTGEAKVRVMRGGQISESIETFTIMPALDGLTVNRVCTSSSSVELIWSDMPSATEYVVYMLGNKYMDSINVVTTNSAQVVVPDLNGSYWFAVQPRGTNGKIGKRSIAINYDGASPSNSCRLDCDSDEDIGVNLVVSPGVSYDGCIGDSIEVTVQLENIGLVPQTGFEVHYQFDNLSTVTETYTGTVNSGTSVIYTFANKQAPLSNGNHNFKVWTDLAADLTVCNDSMVQTVMVQDMLNEFPILEDFEDADSLIGTINNPDGDVTFELEYASINSPGLQSLYINHYNYNALGEVDEFETRTIDFPSNSATMALLHFDVSYRQYAQGYDDELHVLISTDCGASFDTLYSKVGPDLATVDGYTQDFEPNISTWRTDSIDLTDYVNDKVILKWSTVNDYGNNLFIDNLNIITDVTSNVEELGLNAISIAPNPANDFIQVNGLEGKSAAYKLFTVNGQLIEQGNYTGLINVDNISRGLYILEVSVKGHTQTFKVSKL